MKVLHEEGVAIHLDPESCGDVRKDDTEALTGERVSPVLSREIVTRIQGARAVKAGEGLHRADRQREVCPDPARSETRSERGRIPCGNRETLGLTAGRWTRGPRREPQGGTTAMNGHRESDNLIVPAKLPNNAPGAPDAAEGVEGRGLAKGNLVEGDRRRTQSRDRLQQALERVRQSVRRSKGGILTWRHGCASDPRQEPGAGDPHAGIWAGGAGQPASLPRPCARHAPVPPAGYQAR